METTLSCLELETGPSPQLAVIWMHGLGADANDFAGITGELGLPASLPTRFVFPNAPTQPVTINNGFVMRAWYDIIRMDMEREVDAEGVHASIDAICELIERETARGIAPQRVILAGFSQGGAIALQTGLTYPERLGGIIALSTYLPLPAEIDSGRHLANAVTPIFMGHGRSDDVVPYLLAKRTYDLLDKQDYPVEWHEYEFGHTVNYQEILDIGAFLIRHFALNKTLS